MKKIIYLLIILLVLCACDKGGVDTNNNNNPPKDNLIDVMIEARYDYADEFSEGYAVVGRIFEDKMKYNFIDKNNQLLLDEWVDMAFSFSDGLAVVGTYSENHSNFENVLYEYRYIDTNGDIAIDEMWLGNEEFHPNPFYKGYAEVDFVDPYIYDSVYLLDALASNVIDKNGHYLFDFNTFIETGGNDYITFNGNYNRVIESKWEYTMNDYAPYHVWMANYVKGDKANVLLMNDSYDKTSIVDAKGNVVKDFDSFAYKMYNQDLVIVQNGNYYDLYNDDGLFLVGGYLGYESGLDKQIIATVGDDWSDCRYIILNEDMSPLNHVPYQFISVGDDYYLAKTDDGSLYKFDVNGNVLVEQIPEYDYNLMHTIYNMSKGYERNTNFISASLYSNDFSKNCILNDDLELLIEDFDYIVPISDEIIGVCISDVIKFIDTQGNVLNELEDIHSIVYDGYYLYDYNYSEIEEVTYYNLDIDGKNITIDKIDEFDGVVIAENQNSLIKGVDNSDKPHALYDINGNLIDTAQAISLLNDGLYFKSSNVVFDENEYIYVIKDMVVCDVTGIISEIYEELGSISENILAYKKDGKWGYLILNR